MTAEDSFMLKVSVLVPIFNVEEYLTECINSLKKQTLKEIQFVCINDGSTDRSLELLKDLTDSDERFVIIDKPNTGYGNSMNIGLHSAVGKYIGIVESDDYILPDMFEQLFMFAESMQAQIVKANYYEQNKQISQSNIYREVLAGCRYQEVICPREHDELFSKPLCIWSAIYERKFLLDNQIVFNETPGASYQDISFNFLALYLAKRVVLMPGAYYIYRRDNACSSVNNHSKVFAVRDEYQAIERFIAEQGDKDAYQLKAFLKVNSYIWNYYNLASPFQYAFLIEMSSAFAWERENGYLCKELWEKNIWDDIHEIIDCKENYFVRTSKYYVNFRINDMTAGQNLILYECGLKEKLRIASETWLYTDCEFDKKLQMLKECQLTITKILISDKRNCPDIYRGILIHSVTEMIAEKNPVLILVFPTAEDKYHVKELLHVQGFENVIVWDDLVSRCLLKNEND